MAMIGHLQIHSVTMIQCFYQSEILEMIEEVDFEQKYHQKNYCVCFSLQVGTVAGYRPGGYPSCVDTFKENTQGKVQSIPFTRQISDSHSIFGSK